MLHRHQQQLNQVESTQSDPTRIDSALAALALVALAPVFLIASVAIKLSSRGPVFTAEERGEGPRSFRLLKFSAPQSTAVGALLRATSLDELPQLINVLRGEISLLGQRSLTSATC